MIVYLGMPKCASSWLWNKVIHNFGNDLIKEPHTLVEKGKVDNPFIDFSTNNWSMDSSTVRMLDKDVSKYIFIIRDPLELANSYYQQTAMDSESFNEFVFTLVKTKLLCFGDIIERWYNLVDRNKILIYDYNKDIQDKQDRFIKDICQKLNLPSYDTSIPLEKKIAATKNKTNHTCDDKLMEKLTQQIDKFHNIVK